MANTYKDVCIVSRTYEVQGQKKNQYQKVGVAFIKDDGSMSIKLDKFFSPAGVEGDCWLSLFDQKQPNTGSAPQARQQTPAPSHRDQDLSAIPY